MTLRLDDIEQHKATCGACESARTNPHAFEYWAGCIGCEVRSVSNAPKHLREAFYQRIADPIERQAFVDAVGAEFKRRREAGS